MSLNLLINELSNLAKTRSSSIQQRPVCCCNTDSWKEICLQTTATGSQFFVCPACDPQRECTLCNKTGRRFFDEKLCGCLSSHRIVDLLNSAEIPDRYIRVKFTSFQSTHLKPDEAKLLEQNIAQMKSFCENLGSKYFATLFGPVGSGKTLLAVASLKLLIARYKFKGKFIDFQYLLNLIRNQFDQNKTGESLLGVYRETDVLVIDEFAKGRMDKEWPLETLDDLVNYRYNHKKITILTTNYLPFDYKYDPKQKPFVYAKNSYTPETPIHESFWDRSLVERIGGRMYDRLMEVSEFVNFMSLPSFRRVMAKDLLAQLRLNVNKS